MGLHTSNKPKKQRRKAPYPNSVLDRAALVESLESAGIVLKQLHLDGFYQSLHRQHYPELQEFVQNYYKNERKEIETDDPAAEKPLKNAVSNRKNRNRLQLPKPFLEFLLKTPDFVTVTSKIQQKLTSADRSTTKLIVELHDGKVVESVLMRYDKKGSGRASLCVSSQVGCAMGCTFCATGTMGLFGNLTTAEILEQMIHANGILAEEYREREDKSKKLDLVRNVVFMGMGEPLDNYSNVVGACRAMMDRKRWNLAHGRVTVSTVGLISQIRKLTKELPEVSLALSLHAPNQEARTAIVPTATRYPIEELIDALDNHMMAYMKPRSLDGKFTSEERIKESTRRRAMIEYVMLEGESSSIKCAHQLGKLCENRHLVVNLIPYNATDVKDKLQCPSAEHMQKFRDIVASYGTFCTIRRTMGADIASACGQLVKKTTSEKISTETPKDIEDTIGVDSSRDQKNEKKAVVTEEQRSLPTPSQETEGRSSMLSSLSVDTLEKLESGLAIGVVASLSFFLVVAFNAGKKR
eukprot:Nitzschia sp. Nitz4//scaffold122_size67431//25934//27584//NITZ4_006085-RA/size67431-augustus-gene-0.52-mRNA-1//1//CDS//3329534403//1510//frame0